MRLYAFSINGTMLYATGDLSPLDIQYLENFSPSQFLDFDNIQSKQECLIAIFEYLKNKKNINLKYINILQVFRYDIQPFN